MLAFVPLADSFAAMHEQGQSMLKHEGGFWCREPSAGNRKALVKSKAMLVEDSPLQACSLDPNPPRYGPACDDLMPHHMHSPYVHASPELFTSLGTATTDNECMAAKDIQTMCSVVSHPP